MNSRTMFVCIATLLLALMPQISNAEHQYCVIPDRSTPESRICMSGDKYFSSVLRGEFGSEFDSIVSDMSELPLQLLGLPSAAESDKLVLIYPELDTNGEPATLTVFSTPLDPRWADAVISCQSGDQDACALQGSMMIQTGYSAPRDVYAAQSLLAASCDAEVSDACHSLGQMSFYGLVGEKSVDEGVGYYEKACSFGHSESCLQLGHGFTGRFLEMPEDPTQAATYYNSACTLGEMSGCNELGYAYALGEGVSIDRPKAASLWKKACDGDEKIACFNYGDLVQHGSTVEGKDELALSYYQLSCDLGYEKACARLN